MTFDELKARAYAGDAEAMLDLGTYCLNIDFSESIKWFNMSFQGKNMNPQNLINAFNKMSMTLDGIIRTNDGNVLVLDEDLEAFRMPVLTAASMQKNNSSSFTDEEMSAFIRYSSKLNYYSAIISLTSGDRDTARRCFDALSRDKYLSSGQIFICKLGIFYCDIGSTKTPTVTGQIVTKMYNYMVNDPDGLFHDLECADEWTLGFYTCTLVGVSSTSFMAKRMLKYIEPRIKNQSVHNDLMEYIN